MKVEESEKAGSCWESNPGHLACVASLQQLDNHLTILYMYVLHRWD